jgi:hypothetical protein
VYLSALCGEITVTAKDRRDTQRDAEKTFSRKEESANLLRSAAEPQPKFFFSAALCVSQRLCGEITVTAKDHRHTQRDAEKALVLKAKFQAV